VDRARFAALLRPEVVVPLVEDFGLRPHEVLHHVVGPDRAEVPDRWQHAPAEDPVEDALLVRWSAPLVPWATEFVPERERWSRHATGASSPPSA
jgi:hypothetical protein